jgi:hypothetical protein
MACIRRMTHPLDGARRKVRRAKRQIKALRRAEETFRSKAKYQIVPGKHYPKRKKRDYVVQVISEPPLHAWSITIGEIAHNLSSALDHTVWQLALLKTRTPRSNTGFPVFLVGKTKRRDPRTNQPIPSFGVMGKRMIRDLDRKHRALIERLQPYKRGRGNKRSPLYQLREVNNADKHRLVQVVGVIPGAMSMGGWGEEAFEAIKANRAARMTSKVLKDGTVILRDVPEAMHVNQKFTALIAFADGCDVVRNHGVCHTLTVMAEQVSETVEGFRSEFSQPRYRVTPSSR